MNRYEKIAWFNLAMFGLSVVVYFILFLFVLAKFDLYLRAIVSCAAFGLCGFAALGYGLFPNKQVKSALTTDEQEIIIRRKSDSKKRKAFWVVYIFVFLGTWICGNYMEEGSIIIKIVFTPILIFIGIWTFSRFRSRFLRQNDHLMHLQIIYAWINLVGFAVITALFFILDMFLTLQFSSLVLILLPLLGFKYLFFQKRMKEASNIVDETDISEKIIFFPDMDERDLNIQRKARWCGFGVFWTVYIFGILVTWECARFMEIESISLDVSVLPLFVSGAFILIFVVDSIVKVIMYREGRQGEEA
ncbi:hypothetical protein ACFL1R_06485 [Candidatus Latescibacterota bacterium]